MDARNAGLAIALGGAVAVVVGLLVAVGALGWFGRLPGDIRLGDGNVRVYVPLVSMLLASVVLTVLVNLLRRLF